ncbi:MAG: archease [Desulfurococcaceae archaeon]
MMPEERVLYSLENIYDMLEHMSDVYLKAYGGDLLDLFKNAGLALFDTMTDIKKIKGKIIRSIAVDGYDLENLLYKWLEGLLFIYYSERLVCGNIDIHKLVIEKFNGETRYVIEGSARCDEFDPSYHEPRIEVKAATYSLMKIIKTEDKWIAYFVLDI